MTTEIDHSKVKVIPLEIHNVKHKFKLTDVFQKLIDKIKERKND